MGLCRTTGSWGGSLRANCSAQAARLNVSFSSIIGYIDTAYDTAGGDTSRPSATPFIGLRAFNFASPTDLIRWWRIHLAGGTPGGFFTTTRGVLGAIIFGAFGTNAFGAGAMSAYGSGFGTERLEVT